MTEIIDKMSKLEALCLTNVSEPIQYVALQALNADTSNNTNIVKSRLELLIKKAKEIGLDFVEPDGSMYLFAKVPKAGFDGTEFANSCLRKDLQLPQEEDLGNTRTTSEFLPVKTKRN